MNDTRARSPETNVILGTGRGKEVINFLVDIVRIGKIFDTSDLCLDQMIAMNSCRVGDGWHTCRHELKNGHLSGCVLTRYTIWTQSQV